MTHLHMQIFKKILWVDGALDQLGEIYLDDIMVARGLFFSHRFQEWPAVFVILHTIYHWNVRYMYMVIVFNTK